MALYFDATQRAGYVFLMNGNEVQQPISASAMTSQTAQNGGQFIIMTVAGLELYKAAWTAIAWEQCVPPIVATTRTEQAIALCSYFTGTVSQTITPLDMNQYQTQPTGAIDTTVGASYYASMNGDFNDGYTRAQVEANIPACTIKGIVFSVIGNNALTTTTFDLMVNNVVVATKTVATLVTGDQTFGLLSVTINTGDKVALRITTITSVATAITVSPITTSYIIT